MMREGLPPHETIYAVLIVPFLQRTLATFHQQVSGIVAVAYSASSHCLSSFLCLSSSGASVSHLKCLFIHITASSLLLILCEPSVYSFGKAIRVFSLKRMIFVSLEVLVQVIQIRFA